MISKLKMVLLLEEWSLLKTQIQVRLSYLITLGSLSFVKAAYSLVDQSLTASIITNLFLAIFFGVSLK